MTPNLAEPACIAAPAMCRHRACLQVDGAKKLRAKLEGAGKTLVPLLGGNLVDKVSLQQGAKTVEHCEGRQTAPCNASGADVALRV